MTTQVLTASLSASAGGVDLTPYLLDAAWSYALGPAEATLTLAELPLGVERWDELTITAGIIGRTVTQRFGGYVADFRRRHWTPTVTLRAIGYLGLAGRVRALGDDAANLTDAAGTAGNRATYGTWTDPNTSVSYVTYVPPSSSTSTYTPPGVDLSNGGAGQTDGEMVAQVLALLGLTAKCGDIGSTARVLGTQARTSFVWSSEQTAAAMISALDAISLGLRTIDGPDGTIRRMMAGPRSPAQVTSVTLTEGVDILDGASAGDLGAAVANRVSVSGWDNRQGTRVAVATCAHPSPPPGVTYETKTYNSELIEKTFTQDAGAGLSCQEVALWRLKEDATLWTRGSIPTWRDDPISPGDQIALSIPHLDYSGPAWVEAVREGVTSAKVWKRDLTVIWRSPSVAQTLEALLGTYTLGGPLGVNP